jgi:site-specific recombinase XerD
LQDKKNMSHNLVTYKAFTPSLFDEYLLWMKNERNYSASSIRKRMTALSAFLKYASRREMSAINAYFAVIGTEAPTVVRKEFPYLLQYIWCKAPQPAALDVISCLS